MFSRRVKLNLGIIADDLMESVTIFSLDFDQSCIEQFIKGVRGTGGDCKRCFFRKTLWFWGEDGECIEGLPCQRCQEVVRDGNDRLKRNWYRARNTGMGFRLNMWL